MSATARKASASANSQSEARGGPAKSPPLSSLSSSLSSSAPPHLGPPQLQRLNSVPPTRSRHAAPYLALPLKSKIYLPPSFAVAAQRRAAPSSSASNPELARLPTQDNAASAHTNGCNTATSNATSKKRASKFSLLRFFLGRKLSSSSTSSSSACRIPRGDVTPRTHHAVAPPQQQERQMNEWVEIAQPHTQPRKHKRTHSHQHTHHFAASVRNGGFALQMIREIDEM